MSKLLKNYTTTKKGNMSELKIDIMREDGKFKIDKSGMPMTLALDITQVLKEIELHLYTPFDSEIDRTAIYEAAYKAVNSFKKFI